MPDSSYEIMKLAKLLNEAHIPYELFPLPSFAGGPVPMVLRYFGDREKEGFGLTASGWKCSVINNGYGSDKGLLEISCHRDLLTEDELNENKQEVIGNLTADDVFQRIHDDWTRMRSYKNVGMEGFPADEVVSFSAETQHEEFREIHSDFELTVAQFFSVFAESHEGNSTLSSKERIDRYLFPSSDAAWGLSASIFERKLLPLFSNYGLIEVNTKREGPERITITDKGKAFYCSLEPVAFKLSSIHEQIASIENSPLYQNCKKLFEENEAIRAKINMKNAIRFGIMMLGTDSKKRPEKSQNETIEYNGIMETESYLVAEGVMGSIQNVLSKNPGALSEAAVAEMNSVFQRQLQISEDTSIASGTRDFSSNQRAQLVEYLTVLETQLDEAKSGNET